MLASIVIQFLLTICTASSVEKPQKPSEVTAQQAEIPTWIIALLVFVIMLFIGVAAFAWWLFLKINGKLKRFQHAFIRKCVDNRLKFETLEDRLCLIEEALLPSDEAERRQSMLTVRRPSKHANVGGAV